MRRFIGTLSIAATGFFVSPTDAGAVVVEAGADIGRLTSGVVGLAPTTVSPGVFAVDHTFSIDDGLEASGTAAILDLDFVDIPGIEVGIANLTFAVVENPQPGANLAALDFSAFDPSQLTTPVEDLVASIGPTENDALFFNFANLEAGNYAFRVLGEGLGLGGLYVGALNVSVVPLPPAVALLATAIVGLVGVTRLRRRPQAAGAA